jgi:hypothetical protein
LHRAQDGVAVEPRHLDVEQRDVRLEDADLLQRGPAVLGLAHHLEVRSSLQRENDTIPEDRMVVRHIHPDPRAVVHGLPAAPLLRQGQF